MSLGSCRPDRVEIRKVWVAGGEAFVVETSVDGTDEIDRMVRAVARGKLTYELTLFEGDRTESVTVDSGCLQFDDGDSRQLPDQGASLVRILDRLLRGVEVTRVSAMDVFSEIKVAGSST
jgi:hypothetical protein